MVFSLFLHFHGWVGRFNLGNLDLLGEFLLDPSDLWPMAFREEDMVQHWYSIWRTERARYPSLSACPLWYLWDRDEPSGVANGMCWWPAALVVDCVPLLKWDREVRMDNVLLWASYLALAIWAVQPVHWQEVVFGDYCMHPLISAPTWRSHPESCESWVASTFYLLN